MILKTSAVRGNMLTGNVLPRSKLTIDTICPHYIYARKYGTGLGNESEKCRLFIFANKLDVVSRINHFSSILG